MKNRTKTMLCVRLSVAQSEALSEIALRHERTRTGLFADAVARFCALSRAEQRHELAQAAKGEPKLQQVCLYLPPPVLDKARKTAAALEVPSTHVFRAACGIAALRKAAKS